MSKINLAMSNHAEQPGRQAQPEYVETCRPRLTVEVRLLLFLAGFFLCCLFSGHRFSPPFFLGLKHGCENFWKEQERLVVVNV